MIFKKSALTNQTAGFWYAYIEALTALVGLLFILFIAGIQRETVENRSDKILMKTWSEAKRELEQIGAEPKADMEMGGMRITLPEGLLFQKDSSRLSPAGEIRIKEIAERLAYFYKKNENFSSRLRIKVGGHTDRTGGDNINFPLSYLRSSTVAKLIKNVFSVQSVHAEVVAEAYGSKYPVKGHNRDIEPMNRRITIVIQLLSLELFNELRNE